jgi:hypothetical protein
VPAELVALSNMPIIEEKVNGDLKTVSYQETPIMSTYLVAIVVGLFDYVEDHTSDGAVFLLFELIFMIVNISVLMMGCYKNFHRGESSCILSSWENKTRELCIACCCEDA